MDVTTPSLLLAACGIGFFVVPTLVSLAGHLRTRSQRSFSHVVRPFLHTVIALFRGALIVTVALVLDEVGFASPVDLAIGYGVVFTVNGLIVWRERDRRLFVDAKTGFITWKRLSLPFLRTRVAYIDAVAQLHYNSGDLDLFGLDKLEERYSLNYNGANTVRGHYPKKVISKLAENFNRYREMFLKHDSETAKQQRQWFREQYEHSLEPDRQRTKQRRTDLASEKAATENDDAKRAALLEEKKRRDVESKFTS